MILKDVFLLKNPQIISEDKGNKTLKIRGTFQRADEANANKRIYPKSVLENNVKRLQPLIENRALLGELDHPELEATRLSNAAVLITKLGLRGNEVIGEAEILNTPGGKIVKTLIEDKVTIGISSRGVGNLLPEAREDGVKFVGEDYKLITFDIVADPSTRGAYPQVCESKQSVYLDNVIKKAFGEEILIALTKNMISEAGLARTQRVVQSVGRKVDRGVATEKDIDFYKKTRDKQVKKDRIRGLTGKGASWHEGDDASEEEDVPERNVKRGKFHQQESKRLTLDDDIKYLTDKILEEGIFGNLAKKSFGAARSAIANTPRMIRRGGQVIRHALDIPHTKDAGEHAYQKQREREFGSRLKNLKHTRRAEIKALKSHVKKFGSADSGTQELRGAIQRRNAKMDSLKGLKRDTRTIRRSYSKPEGQRGDLSKASQNVFNSPTPTWTDKDNKPMPLRPTNSLKNPKIQKVVGQAKKLPRKIGSGIKTGVVKAGAGIRAGVQEVGKMAALPPKRPIMMSNQPIAAPEAKKKAVKSLAGTPAKQILKRKRTILAKRTPTVVPDRAPTELIGGPMMPPSLAKKKKKKNLKSKQLEYIVYLSDKILMEGDARARRLSISAERENERALAARKADKLHVKNHHLDKSWKFSSMAGREKAKGMFRKSYKQRESDPLSSEKNRRIASGIMKNTQPRNKID